MASLTPNAKIVSVALGGAAATILIWVIKTYGKVDLPPEVAAAVTTIIVSILGWAVPNGGSA